MSRSTSYFVVGALSGALIATVIFSLLGEARSERIVSKRRGWVTAWIPPNPLAI